MSVRSVAMTMTTPTYTVVSNTSPSETLTTAHNGSMDVDSYLQHLSDQMAISLLPAILIIGVLMVIAVIGNSLVFYVYLTKFNPSSTRSVILALAVLDLIASCVSMPGEMSDLRSPYNFPSVAFCKCIRFGTTSVLIASGLTLLVVAGDRYNRICHPMRDQLTAGRARKIVFLCVFLACLSSIPSAVIYGRSRVPTEVEGVLGVECSIDQKYHKHILPLLNNIFQGAIFLAVFVAIIVLYSLLGRVVLRQKKFRQSVRKTSREEADRDHSITDGGRDGSTSPGSPVSPVPDVIASGSFHPPSGTDQELPKDRKKSISSTVKMSVFHRPRKPSTADLRTIKTTLMLFMITLVFVISFLPHLILKCLQASLKDFPTSSSTSNIVLYNVFVRSYFFNSVANCFIYGFCSPKFRRESKVVIMKLFCCCKKK